MRTRGFDVTRAQRAWVCDWTFMVFTDKQFTAEEHTVRNGSRWLLLAILKSYLSARAEYRVLAATKEQRRAVGWS